MRLVLDAEQDQLRASVRKLLTDHCPAARVREVMEDSGFDRDLWRRLAAEVGLTGLVIPEAHGGSGAGHVERAIVLEELGRAVAPVPFFASAVLATDAALALDDSEALAGLASGDTIGTLATGENWSPAPVTATERDDGWVLDGHAPFVLSGDSADLVYVHNGDWFAVAGGFTRKPLRTLDLTRPVARLEFSATPARKIPADDGVLARIRDQAAVALAAEQVGGLGRVLEMTTDYAKARIQFGRAIGSYQAVKHNLADIEVAWEQAVSLVRQAAWTADNEPGELAVAAATTQAFVGPAYFAAARDGVTLHGGIGYTWEHEAHLYYKRAKSSELLFPAAAQELAHALGLDR